MSILLIGDSVPCRMLNTLNKIGKEKYKWNFIKNCENICPLAIKDLSLENEKKLPDAGKRCLA